MEIRQALIHGRQFLAPVEARLLLEHVLQKEHSYLIAHDDEALTAAQWGRYRAAVTRAAQGEPLPYILGRAPFYGRDFIVTPAVLIPRPETEQLVAEALNWSKQHQPRSLLDVGTGSGCIPITLRGELAREGQWPHIAASDLSATALAVAQQNGRRQDTVVQWLQMDLLAAVRGPLDLLTANLPYIAEEEWAHLDIGVKWHEPALALRGGTDGLQLIHRLLIQATARMAAKALLLLEIGWQQGPAAQQIARQHFPTATVVVLPDLAGQDRLLRIETTG